MATKADEVNDAMVDTYRALREINRKAAEAATTPAARPITPGAGVDPKRVIKPSKRVRNMHRITVLGAPLKRMARAWAAGGPMAALTQQWFANKKAVR